VKHLLGIDDLGAEGIGEVLRLADSFLEVTRRDIPKVPALRGKTVVAMFYEASTRTRLSFETAAKRLSADTMTFHGRLVHCESLCVSSLTRVPAAVFSRRISRQIHCTATCRRTTLGSSAVNILSILPQPNRFSTAFKRT